MNDPMDLGFYIANSELSNSDICKFQNELNKSFVIISLASTIQNRRLWNYYTNGMKGFVLNYKVSDLKNSLRKKGAAWPITRKVSYGEQKLELSDMLRTFLDKGKLPALSKTTLLFHKDTSWESEDEYRLVTKADFLEIYDGAKTKGGICIDNVTPTEIFVGYKMDEGILEQVKSYAAKKGIKVEKYIPDFRDSNSKKFVSELVVEKVREETEISKADDELLEFSTLANEEFENYLRGN